MPNNNDVLNIWPWLVHYEEWNEHRAFPTAREGIQKNSNEYQNSSVLQFTSFNSFVRSPLSVLVLSIDASVSTCTQNLDVLRRIIQQTGLHGYTIHYINDSIIYPHKNELSNLCTRASIVVECWAFAHFLWKHLCILTYARFTFKCYIHSHRWRLPKQRKYAKHLHASTRTPLHRLHICNRIWWNATRKRYCSIRLWRQTLLSMIWM